MKTKNVRVRLSDIKSGIVIYVSHPVYGIRKVNVIGRPYMNGDIGLFAMEKTSSGGCSTFSLNDAGVLNGDSYNYRRSFFKLKQAEEWAQKMSFDEGFKKHQADHEDWVRRTNMLFPL